MAESFLGVLSATIISAHRAISHAQPRWGLTTVVVNLRFASRLGIVPRTPALM